MQESRCPLHIFLLLWDMLQFKPAKFSENSEWQKRCSPHSYAYLENLKQWKANKLKKRGDSTHPCCVTVAPSLCLLGAITPEPHFSTMSVFSILPVCYVEECSTVRGQYWGGSKVLTVTWNIKCCLKRVKLTYRHEIRLYFLQALPILQWLGRKFN